MDAYNRFLTHHPISAKSMTCAVLLGAGDVICQLMEMWCAGDMHPLDVKRISTMSIFGGVYLGPVLHWWYSLVLGRYFTAPGLMTAAKKTIMDQVVFAPFGCVSFFAGLTLLNGGTLEQSQGKIKRELWPTLVANWAVWPIVQGFNFALVPIPYQVLTVKSVAIFWNAYMSYVQFTKK